MPYATTRREKMQQRNGRFVHYTSAENALKIIQSKEIWTRNTTCMADYREVQHGYDLLSQFFSQQSKRAAFFEAVNLCAPGIAAEAVGLFDQWWNNIRLTTYICSISEHEDSEDVHGRLSMWRAFGRLPARAAIVIKMPSPDAAEGLQVLLSPVAYFGYEKVEEQLWSVISNVKADAEFLQSLDRERIKSAVFYMLVAAAVSLKHEGFAEEREWRVIYLPDAHPSKHIRRSTKVVEGIPQVIFKIPLQDIPEDDVNDVEIPKLVDRIIIGPTAYPIAIYTAFVIALQEAGVTDAAARTVISGIPLRS